MALDPGVPQLEEAELADRIEADEPVVVLFYADWCGFCRAFMGPFQERVEALGIEAVAANISDRSDPRWSAFDVDVIPTLIGFRSGDQVARIDGRAGRGLQAKDVDRLAAKLGEA